MSTRAWGRFLSSRSPILQVLNQSAGRLLRSDLSKIHFCRHVQRAQKHERKDKGRAKMRGVARWLIRVSQVAQRQAALSGLRAISIAGGRRQEARGKDPVAIRAVAGTARKPKSQTAPLRVALDRCGRFRLRVGGCGRAKSRCLVFDFRCEAQLAPERKRCGWTKAWSGVSDFPPI